MWRFLITLLIPCVVMAQTYTGGLYFMRAPDLVLERQEVVLGLDKVTVTYVLTNNSSQDIVETIIFPLPSKTEDNGKNFSVAVNNHNIQYQTIQRAISFNGRDVSEILKSLGLPFNPIAAMQTLDTSQNRDNIINKLRAQNLIDQKEETPVWFVKTFYNWKQTFPAKATIKIEQNYRPAVASTNIKLNGLSSIFTWPVRMVKKAANIAIHWTLEDKIAAGELQAQLEKYNPQIKNFCPTLADYEQLLIPTKQDNDKKLEMKELNFAYANYDSWTAPIRRFSLRIETPKNMQPMLCWHSELKKSADNSLVFEAENYVPVQNVNVLYIEH